MRIQRLFLCLAIVVTGLLLVGASRLVWWSWDRFERGRFGVEATRSLDLVLRAQERVSAERGPTNGALGADTPLDEPKRFALLSAREATDAAIRAAMDNLDRESFVDLAAARAGLESLRLQLAGARRPIDTLVSRPLAERSQISIEAAVAGMIALIPEVGPVLNVVEREAAAADPELVPTISVARLAGDLRDHAGHIGSVFTVALATGRPLNEAELMRIAELRGRVEVLRDQIRLSADRLGAGKALAVRLADMDAGYFGKGLDIVDATIRSGRAAAPVYGMTTADLAARYVPEMKSIVEVRDIALSSARTIAAGAADRASWQLGVTLLAIVGSLLTVLLAILLFRNRVIGPLTTLTPVVEALAQGRFDVAIPRHARPDEIGRLTMALEVFRDTAEARARLEGEAARAGASTDRDRKVSSACSRARSNGPC